MKRISILVDNTYCVRSDKYDNQYVCPMLQLKLRNNGNLKTSLEAFCLYAGAEYLGGVEGPVDSANLQVKRGEFCIRHEEETEN